MEKYRIEVSRTKTNTLTFDVKANNITEAKAIAVDRADNCYDYSEDDMGVVEYSTDVIKGGELTEYKLRRLLSEYKGMGLASTDASNVVADLEHILGE